MRRYPRRLRVTEERFRPSSGGASLRGKGVLAALLTVSAVALYVVNNIFVPPGERSAMEEAASYWRAAQTALESLGLPPDRFRRAGDDLQVEIPTALPVQVVHARLARDLREAGAEILLAKEELVPPGLEIVFGKEGRAYGRIEVRTDEATRANPIKVALIIDDLGYSFSKELRELLELPYKFTVAVIPGLKRSLDAAEAASKAGKEVIVHMPMEPQQGEVEDDGFAIYTSLPADEIGARVRRALRSIPQARGMNNHEGSKATADLGTMAAVMKELRSRGVYFVDSRTNQQSKAFAAARRAGVPALRSTGFLDAKDDEEWIRRKFWELLGKGSPGTGVVMIAHPRKTTLRLLRELMPKVAGRGVRFVYASELAR